MGASIVEVKNVEEIGGEIGDGLVLGFKENPTPFESLVLL